VASGLKECLQNKMSTQNLKEKKKKDIFVIL
jgi:hypothetical protein